MMENTTVEEQSTTSVTKVASTVDVERSVVVVLLLVFSVVGVAGNVVVLVVFSRRGDHLASTVFIVVLAAVDFTTCLVVAPFTVFIELARYDVGVDFVCKLYQFLITCNIPFSAMIMVAIAVDRYLSICRPMVGALTSRKAWLVTTVLGVFAAAIGLCVALMYSVRQHEYVLLAADDRDDQSAHMNTTSTTDTGRRRCLVSPSSDDEVVTTADCPTTSVMVEVNHGVCNLTYEVFSSDFVWHFQKVYNGLFLVCFISVVALYVLIYRSVLLRRSRHQRQKLRSMSLIASSSQRQRAPARQTTGSIISVVEDSGAAELQVLATGNQRIASTSADDAVLQSVRDRKRNRVANVKTAGMLFVVTVVFVVTFLPAFLMTVDLLPYNMIVFYMYFANYVANPIIYSFMNHNFRSHLKHMICRRRGQAISRIRTSQT